MASYLVLGGGVGKAILKHLHEQPDTDRLAIMDKDPTVLRIGLTLDDSLPVKVEFIVADIYKMNLLELFSQFDVIISALPASMNLELARAAVEAKRPFCDLGGVIDVTKEQINQLNRLALSNRVSVIPDCGLMPGLGILMARKLVYEMKKVQSIEILVGGLPQKPRPPLYYQRVFNEQGLASICYENSPVLTNGVVHNLIPFSGYETIKVVELKKFSKEFDGWIEAFITAGASIAPWTFKEFGVQNFCEKTVRWPGFVNFVKNIPREQFIEKVSPHISIPVTAEDPDLVWMEVEASTHDRSGKVIRKSYSLLDLYNNETGLTAMERTTGFPTAIIARMMAKGFSASGVNTPETAFNKDQLAIFWKELKKCFKIESFQTP